MHILLYKLITFILKFFATPETLHTGIPDQSACLLSFEQSRLTDRGFRGLGIFRGLGV